MLAEKCITLINYLRYGCKTTLEIKSFHVQNRFSCKFLNFINSVQYILSKVTLIHLHVVWEILQDFLPAYPREYVGERVRQEVVVDLFQSTLIKVAILILWTFSEEVCAN